MSGHSKWHNIQAKKGKADAARGKVFTKLGRELLIAVKQGGPDPAGNSKLKDVIAKCKAANMPNDTINNAIKKASGSADAANYEEITYEGYGVAGVAVIVNASTDNRNRTAADVRHVFDKAGGNLGTSGCVSYMFEKKGIIVIEKGGNSQLNYRYRWGCLQSTIELNTGTPMEELGEGLKELKGLYLTSM